MCSSDVKSLGRIDNGNEEGSQERNKEARQESHQKVGNQRQTKTGKRREGDATKRPPLCLNLADTSSSRSSPHAITARAAPSGSSPSLSLTAASLDLVSRPRPASSKLAFMPHPDVCIAGAGVIGLSLALELNRRGARVTLIDRGPAISEASGAAAGMLAANDPHNPTLLQPLSDLSLSLYPAFLAQIANLSDVRVPFQTDLTLQANEIASVASLSRAELDVFLPAHNLTSHYLTLLDEHSIDPRQLASALTTAAENTSIKLRLHTPVVSTQSSGDGLTVVTAADRIPCAFYVDCTGAWTTALPGAVVPRKGQMLSVALPQAAPLWLVLRTQELYIVPRTTGPNAGRAIIGATVEDAGFDKSTSAPEIAHLRDEAVRLLPALAHAAVLDQWAGIRPATADGLPLLGPHPDNPRHLLATGHFRNGILLAPATAHLLAQLVFGDAPSLDLDHFAPARFAVEAIP